VNFDRAAEYYDATRALPADSLAELTGLLAAELADRQPCLEIGIGTGRIALTRADGGIRLAGTDIAAAMLRRLVANAGGASPFPLLQADATRLPLAAAAFGSVLAVHVLHLIPDWRVAVDEAMRVLRPGGVLVASFPGGGRSSRLRRDSAGAPPWRTAVRAALRRHGRVRVVVGARDQDQVAGYLDGRAVARSLESVTVREALTLGQTIERIERQLYSWIWPYSPDQARAAGGEIRAWAAREDIPLDVPHEVESDIRWWAFDRSSLPSTILSILSAIERTAIPPGPACGRGCWHRRGRAPH